MRLVSCSGCERHVRADDEACPFCGAAVEAPPEPTGRRPVGRLGRAAMFAFGASLALAGCADDRDPPAPAYGTPPMDAGPTDDAGGPAPAYGAVPADAGPMSDDAGGGPAPAYGAAPVDGG